MEKSLLNFSIRHIQAKIILFVGLACLTLSITGNASAVNEAANIITTEISEVPDSIDPGVALYPPGTDTDPDMLIPVPDIVDPDFSISKQADEITTVPFTNDSTYSSDANAMTDSADVDNAVIIPRS